MTTKPRKKVVAFISDAIYPFNKGGKEKRLFEIATRLVRDDQEVHIYTMKWWKGPRVIQQDGLYLHAISKLHPLYKNERRSMSEAILFGFAVYKLLFARFDVIEVDSMPFFPLYSARIVTWLKRKQLVAVWHEVTPLSTWTKYAGKIAGFIAWLIERGAARLPDKITSVSELTTERLQKMHVRKPVVTVPLGVDASGIKEIPAAELTSDIIYSGRLLAHKNIDVLIRSVAIIKQTRPDVRCLIIGDGPEKPRLERLIRELGLKQNVRIVKFIDDAYDVYALMKSSRVFALPSTREGFSLVVIEAHAAGIPVVTTSHRDNNARNLVQDGINGFVTEATPAAFATALMRTLYPRVSLNPSYGLAQYDWNVIASKVELALNN